MCSKIREMVVVTVFLNSKGFKFPSDTADDEARPTAVKINAFDDFVEGEDRSFRELFE